jgi:hypothetical protein
MVAGSIPDGCSFFPAVIHKIKAQQLQGKVKLDHSKCIEK